MGTSLSIAMCSNRPPNLANAGQLLASVLPGDEVIVVADLAPGPAEASVLAELASAGATVVINGANRGLSYCRNQALARCKHQHLVYVDDDVAVPQDTVEAIRVAANDGAGIVGVRLLPAFARPAPWWLTGGQFHYLGVHHTMALARTWGACMAIDADLARRTGLSFRDDLGRRGSGLQSGDDTTFLAGLRAAGTAERFLWEALAHHTVAADRTRLRYLLRRAWWQGRSEVRRASARTGLGKEWRRAIAVGPAAAGPARRFGLAVIFTGAMVSGLATEAVIRLGSR